MYNEIQVGKNKYYFRPGKENFIGDLVAKFPGEELPYVDFSGKLLVAPMQ
jgi:hypothetical protein